MQSISEDNDGWLEFTKWTYSSFPEYLTIEEKINIFMGSWVEGQTGWDLMFAWRLLSFAATLYFFIESVTGDAIRGDIFSGFRYMT